MSPMYILGIHMGHDSAAALIKDGEVVAAVAEERLMRLKHYAGVPVESIKYCLESHDLDINDLDAIALPSITVQPELETLLGVTDHGLARQLPIESSGKPNQFRLFLLEMAKRLNRWTAIEPPLYIKRYNLKDASKVHRVDHHLSHAASAYYGSGFTEKTLVMTADGSGDGHSITIWLGENGKLSLLHKIGREGSLGFFYSTVTEALGWWVGDGEGKTMGLAPYGSTKKTHGVLDGFYPVFANGKLVKPYDFGFPSIWYEAGSVHWHFKDSPAIAELVKKYGKEDIAAEAQRVLEEQMLNIVTYWAKETGATNFAAAGGIFLNVKMNQRIWESDLFKAVSFFPDAGDAGVAIGAALYGYHVSQPEAPMKLLANAYWGPGYTDNEIQQILDTRQIRYQKIDNPSEVAADLLAKGKIVGWFQGKMEAGPRALGNRSILMDPGKAENKDIINSRVKYREAFRPFCPSMLAEAGSDYLVKPTVAPYMIVSFDVIADKQKEIPAVVHVDGTARPQLVTRQANPLYYDLIKRFGELTGVPVLLNTSFNIKGQPIVCTPDDAIKCFYDTGLDAMVIGHYLIDK